MAIKVGINGFGRIGRQVLKAITDRYPGKLEVVAINDLVATDVNANLLKYDSNYGRWHEKVEATDKGFIIGGREIAYYNPPVKKDTAQRATPLFTSRARPLTPSNSCSTNHRPSAILVRL